MRQIILQLDGKKVSTNFIIVKLKYQVYKCTYVYGNWVY